MFVLVCAALIMLHVFAQLCRVKHIARPSVPCLVKGGGETNLLAKLSSSLLQMSDWKEGQSAGHVEKLKLSAAGRSAPMAWISGAAAATINGGG